MASSETSKGFDRLPQLNMVHCILIQRNSLRCGFPGLLDAAQPRRWLAGMGHDFATRDRVHVLYDRTTDNDARAKRSRHTKTKTPPPEHRFARPISP